jgi:thiamine-phosphate pyrophosphorylase
MKFPNGINIYAISDSGFDHLSYFRQLIVSGVDIIQLRDKEMSDRGFYALAVKLRKLAAKHKKIFIINDRVDVAKAVGCDGIHLGEDDLPISMARKIIGKSKIIGYSAHSFKSALKAWRQGADYISVGPIFKSPTKKYLEPISRSEIQLIIRKIKLPLVAIGGINLRNIDMVKEFGFRNVALISALRNAKNKKKFIHKLRMRLEK